MADVRDGIYGLAVADALGVPVEFTDRVMLKQNPVTGMRGYGTYNKPKGTWSDDTSMALCLADSLSAGVVDDADIMQRFCRWRFDGEYTPHGVAFDIGGATERALNRFRAGAPPLQCGGTEERDNGNGALMRILPAVYIVRNLPIAECMQTVHTLTALTHAHPRALIASGIYVRVCVSLLHGQSAQEAVFAALAECSAYYQPGLYAGEWKHYKRLMDGIAVLPEGEIRSSGYAVDTLEAAIWCLLNTNSYSSCVLRAVNLGADTDTVGAVAGGMAGIIYGYETIPSEWLQALQRRDLIEAVCGTLQRCIDKKQ